MPDIPIPAALALFAILWFAAGYAARRPRPTDTDAKMTPAQAMANATSDTPAELGRLERGHDDTLTAIPPVTQQLPALEPTVTGDLGNATPEPERPTLTLAIGAPDPEPSPGQGPMGVEWLPEREASVVLTISHLPPKDNGATVHGRRFTDITPGRKLPQAVWDTWATVLGLRDAHGGTVLVAIKHPNGRRERFEPSKERPNDWPRGASQALKQTHHTPTPDEPDSVPVPVRTEAWAGRW